MPITQDWFLYERYVEYVKYLESKKYKTDQEKSFELYARDVAKALHDANMDKMYPGAGPVA